MRLIDAFPLTAESRVAIVGAGGKSTTLFHLARQWGKACLLSTSTHLATAQLKEADRHFVVQQEEELLALEPHCASGVTLVTGPLTARHRAEGLDPALMGQLFELASKYQIPVLVEADGSRGLPLKAPASHEPAIPVACNRVIVVAGLNALGQCLSPDVVHRPEVFSSLSGIDAGSEIKLDALLQVLCHADGGLKNIPPGALVSLLFTHSNLQAETAIGAKKGEILKHFDQILFSRQSDFNQEISLRLNKVAGVVLAAGGSTRFGKTKALLDWQGEAFVKRVCKSALAAGLDEVVLVTGANSAEVSAAIEGLPVQLIHNAQWQNGQSGSVKLAVQALGQSVSAIVFLLVDQPQLPPTLISQLYELYAQSAYKVIATEVDGHRGNPVLFDQNCFPALLQIKGDQGGRQIFSKYSLGYLPWHDVGLAIDVDNPADYEKLCHFYGYKPEK